MILPPSNLIYFVTLLCLTTVQVHTFLQHLSASGVQRKTSQSLLSMQSFGWKRGTTRLNKSNFLEKELFTLLRSNELSGRGAKASLDILSRIDQLVQQLENTPDRIQQPTSSPLIDGCWRLVYTSSPGTNSPIQRTFTALDNVSIYQIVNVVDRSNSFLPDKLPDVSNTVCFGDKARLRVTALASTSKLRLIEPRKGDGKILGLNVFGISSSSPPRTADERIDFAFQDAAFEFKQQPLPLPSIPYPVPFKLLGDEAKGWIDVTYLSSELRIARGNKGTLFLLEKVDPRNDSIAAFAIEDLRSSQKSIAAAKTSAEKIAKSSASTTTAAAAGRSSKSGAAATTSLVNPTDVSKSSSAAATSAFALPDALVKLLGASSSSSSSSRKKTKIAIIFPAQLGTEADYCELSNSLQQVTAGAVKSYVVPLQRLDWPLGLLPSFLSWDYARGTLQPAKTLQFYYEKVNAAVAKALDENDNDNVELILVAHSIGGWIARAWLSEYADTEVKQKVGKLITLGSPHNPPPTGSPLAALDQTRGLLTYINDKFPGAFESDVEYVSIIGTEVTGNLSADVDSLLAYFSYLFLAGKGDTLGDGIIPVETALLRGAIDVPIEGVKHTNYIPTPGRSLKLPWAWYGSQEVVKKWFKYL